MTIQNTLGQKFRGCLELQQSRTVGLHTRVDGKVRGLNMKSEPDDLKIIFIF